MRFPLKRLATIALLALLPALSQAETKPFKIDSTDLTHELQKTSHASGLKLVWWIPKEFWIASSKKQGDMDKLVEALDPYILVAVVDARVSQFGAFTYSPEEDTRKSLKIFDAAGNAYAPIEANDVSGDVKNVLAIIKPILTNAMGDLGKNVNFFVFPKNGADGKPMAVTTAAGKFQVQFGGEDFNFRLPLASLKPKLKCKNDTEQFPSNYKYCPYDGTPLVPLSD